MRQDVQAVQSFIDTMVGIPKFSYPAKQNAPRPKGEFAHVQLLEEYQQSIPAAYIKDQDDLTTTTHYKSLARLRFRVAIIETDGIASTKIMHGWTSEPMKALMNSLEYGFIGCSPISIEDAKLEKHWEPRQGMSLDLYVTRTFEEVVDNITAVTISGKFITPALDTYLLNIDVNNN
jgi:hypothetical protein